MQNPLTTRSTRRTHGATSPFSLFDKFFGEFFTDPVTSSGIHSPPVDIFETDEALTLEFELPGVDESSIDIEVVGNQLSLKATRAGLAEDVRRYATEHRRGDLSRRIVLPRGLDTEGIEASWSNGVLTLSVPKAAEAKARKIEIRGS